MRPQRRHPKDDGRRDIDVIRNQAVMIERMIVVDSLLAASRLYPEEQSELMGLNPRTLYRQASTLARVLGVEIEGVPGAKSRRYASPVRLFAASESSGAIDYDDPNLAWLPTPTPESGVIAPPAAGGDAELRSILRVVRDWALLMESEGRHAVFARHVVELVERVTA